jgi:murein DD-endopeptidase MepM/ murein hydrolase activator NlpD
MGKWIIAGLVALLGGAAAEAHFKWPNSGKVTSNYYSPRSYGYHRAIDIAGPYGETIKASYGGTVQFRGWSGGYGNLVILKHVNGYQTYYAHCKSFAVSTGQSVPQMKVIAYEGSTGNSTGPHCHFEIRRWGNKLYVPATVGSWKTQGYNIPYSYAGIP